VKEELERGLDRNTQNEKGGNKERRITVPKRKRETTKKGGSYIMRSILKYTLHNIFLEGSN
jgi:hypothetical protein